MKENSRKIYIGCLIGALLTVAFSSLDMVVSSLFYHKNWGFFLQDMPINLYIDEYTYLWVVGIFGLCCGFWLGGKINKESSFAIKNKSFVFLTSCFVSILGVGLLVKEIWQRPRPFNILQFGGSEEYVSPLVLTNSIGDSFSFPSGHTLCACLLLVVALLLPKWIRNVGFAFALAVVIVVAVSRVVSGYHFLSDTIFSFLLALSLITFFYQAFKLNQE